MTQRAPWIHLLGVVSLNGGDAAILEAQVRLLRHRWPDARIVVHDRDPVAAVRYLPSLTFVPSLLRQVEVPPRRRSYRGAVRVRRAVARARVTVGARFSVLRRLLPRPVRAVDVALYTGGTSLTENYSLSQKLYDLDLIRRAGVPYALLPQSAGPFIRPENRTALAPVLAGAALVMLRDERSHGYVVEVGALPERCVVVPDVVFALAREDLATLPVRPGAVAGRPERLAVSVREWRHFTTRPAEEGRSATVEAFRHLVTTMVRERDAEVTFISTCQGRPEYTHDDSVFAAEVAAGLDDDVACSVDVDAGFYDADGLIDRLASFDALVSMRLHAAILGVCSALPTLTVAYEYKSTEVWRQLGMDEFTLDLETLDGFDLVRRTGALLDRRDQVRADLAPRVAAMRNRALALGDDLTEALELQMPAALRVRSARR